MRVLILTRMPILSSRIHRAAAAEDHPEDWEPSSETNPPLNPDDTSDVEWSWSSAEERLSAAFQERGFLGWAEAVMHELEAEGRVERKKRGHS